MSTIERAAARLGTIGKVRAEPVVSDPALIPDVARVELPTVEADRWIRASEFHCQRQTHIAQTDNRGPRVGEICDQHVQAIRCLGVLCRQPRGQL